MATLMLCQGSDGAYLLQGAGDRTRNTDFSLFALDGEGGDPFAYPSSSWETVEGVATAEYDPSDTDTFWQAREAVMESARVRGLLALES